MLSNIIGNQGTSHSSHAWVMEDDCPSDHSSISFVIVAKTMNVVVLYFSDDCFSHDVSNKFEP